VNAAVDSSEFTSYQGRICKQASWLGQSQKQKTLILSVGHGAEIDWSLFDNDQKSPKLRDMNHSTMPLCDHQQQAELGKTSRTIALEWPLCISLASLTMKIILRRA
jgi:hypothetical protein